MKETRVNFKNGIRLVHEFLPATSSATMSIMVNAGSSDESREEYGISHFIEHVLSSGSKNFPDPMKKDLFLESLGTVKNAWTFNNVTNYWMKFSSRNFEKVAGLLLDEIFNPLFTLDSIEKEKRIIIEEIKMGDDSPFNTCWENLCKIIFRDSPLEHPVIGNVKSVSNFDRELILNYYKKLYTLDNMIFWVGGDIDFGRVKAYFEKVDASLAKKTNYIEDKFDRVGQSYQFTSQKFDMDSYYLLIAFDGFDVSDRNLESLSVANMILGGGRGSLLNKALKIEKPLVSDYSSELITFKQNGLLLVSLACEKKNIKNAINVSLDQIKNIINCNFSSDELTRAKSMNEIVFLSCEESSEAFGISENSSINLTQKGLLTGRRYDYSSVLRKIQRLKKSEISNSLLEKIKDANIAVSIIGPEKISEFKIPSLL